VNKVAWAYFFSSNYRCANAPFFHIPCEICTIGPFVG
jgi:hypothetical protein